MKILFKTKNLISFLLIVGFIIPSISLLPSHKAQAQSSGWAYNYIDGLGATRESFSYPSSTACETARMQAETNGDTVVGSCFEIIDVEAQAASLSSGAPKAGSTAAEALTNKGCLQLLGTQFTKLFGKKVITKTKDGVSQAKSAAMGVPITNEFLESKIKEVQDDTSETKRSTGYLMKKGGCLDSIAKIIIKNMIGYITASLISWINTGFEGKPFYLENPDGFFKNIAKNQFLEFGNSIKDPALFPFGRNFIAGAAMAFNRKFERNAQYSLNTLIAKTHPGKTGIDFSSDFNVGGWDAYLGMTAPQNNPIGFSIVAANELSVRLEGTAVSKANQVKETLQQAGGFLGDERCVEPTTSPRITHEEDARARRGEVDNVGIPYRICQRFEYVTPGKLIGDKLTNAANSSEKRLEIADDLNAALAALADALIAKGITTLTNEGLKALSGPGNTPTAWNDGLNNQTYGSTGTQFASFYLAPGSWLSEHPGFDLKTDLTQAVVDEQRTYQDKLGSYTEALHEVTKWVRQLDYCIPGPNPDWETTSSETLNSFGKVGFGRDKKWWETDVAKTINFLFDPGGYFSAIGIDKRTDKEDIKAASAAAAVAIETILKVQISHKQDQMVDQGGVEALLGNVFNAYRKKIQEIYFSGPLWPRSGIPKKFMPGVTIEAAAEFEQIDSYEKIAENNLKEIAFRKSIITRIESLKQKIDKFNSQATHPNPLPADQADPEDQQVIAEFARLSAYFVDGDDIAEVDNLYKETVDKTAYVKEDLVGGSYGCEKFLEDLWNPAGKTAAQAQDDQLTYSTYVRRQPYPFPIDHFYASVKYSPSTLGNHGYANGPYHVPYSSGEYTNMNNLWWEGFLPFSYYYNNWAGPFDDDGGKAAARCAESVKYEQDAVWPSEALTCLSLPNQKEDPDADGGGGCKETTSYDTADIGGLDPNDTVYPNQCGVVTKGFEKVFQVY